MRDHPEWGGYLTARFNLVSALADQVRACVADSDIPEWATQRGSAVPTGVLADVWVWRAAMQVGAGDRRPTGPVQLQKVARTWQRHLDRQVAGDRTPAMQEWGWLLNQVSPGVTKDAFTSALVDRLAAISRAGVDARLLLRSAASTGGPLPDDHAAAALWWRISRHLTPAVAAQIDTDHTLAPPWIPRLAELVRQDRTDTLQSIGWWPPLVNAVEHALQRGWRLDDLLIAAGSPQDGFVDACQALLWRISLLTDPIPTDTLHEPFLDSAPSEMWPDTEPGAGIVSTARDEIAIHPSSAADIVVGETAGQDWVEPDLAVAALVRGVAGPPKQTDADIDRMFTRTIAWRQCAVSRDRMIQINQMTLAHFRSHFPASWGQAYLVDRFGQDLTDDQRFRPGQAPAGWTSLVHHMRRRGVTDQEMIVAGVATVASTGRLIDRFRDRVVFPIIHNQEILGFVGRRHPDLTDADRGGPKYLNTADTPLFHKGAQLFGAVEEHLAEGGVPVIVEGPMDAIAVTVASGGRHIGVAALGTSLTDEQASQLARIGQNPIVATDADIAGRVAAERDFWLLTPYRLDPRYAQLPEGSDPADLRPPRSSRARCRPGADAAAGRTAHQRTAHQPATRSGPARGHADPGRPTSGVLGQRQQHHQLPPQRAAPGGSADPARPGEGLEHRPATGHHQAPASRQRRQETADRAGPTQPGAAVGGPGQPTRPTTPPPGRLARAGATHAAGPRPRTRRRRDHSSRDQDTAERSPRPGPAIPTRRPPQPQRRPTPQRSRHRYSQDHHTSGIAS
jgi:hypothetical protein